jgi:transposase-like protein
MYVQGVSTRKVRKITQELCGLDVSASQVSRATAELDKLLTSWRNRPLPQVEYLLLDARYEKVRQGGHIVDCGVFIAVGILPDGKRSVLGVSVALSESEVHWRAFIESLQARGLSGVKMVISDAHSGLKAALAATLPGTPKQRCQFHLQQNAVAYVPRTSMRREVAAEIRRVFNAPDFDAADVRLKALVRKYAKSAPLLSNWLESAIPEGLTVFLAPPDHRRRLRTSNMLERLNKEVNRRTRVATIFPNVASLLRLVTAVVSEVSDEWEIGRVYLSMWQEASSPSQDFTERMLLSPLLCKAITDAGPTHAQTLRGLVVFGSGA